MSLEAGLRLGPYEVLGLLGAGGMGVVYRARDIRLDRLVALKILPPEVAGDPERRQRFAREARVIASLTHPNICTLYEFDHAVADDGTETDVLVLEYLQGETLASYLRRSARGHSSSDAPPPPARAGRAPARALPLADALAIAIQVADALAAAHAHGVVHRDLKPGNIMLTGWSEAGSPQVKLLDFGLAKLRAPGAGGVTTWESTDTASLSLTGEGRLVGTLPYMAPEQLEGTDADARTDVFALGALLYEMVAGRRAFDGASQVSLIAAIMNADPPPLSEQEPLTPPALEQLVHRCLAKRPEDRWTSAAELAEGLRHIAHGDARGHPIGFGRRTRAWPRRRGLPAAAALLLAAGAGAGYLTLQPQPGSEEAAAAATASAPGLARVAVLPFENRTGDPSLDWLGVMVAEVITRGLSGMVGSLGSPSVVPVPSDVVSRTLAGRPVPYSPGGLAEELSADTVVTGAYYLDGGRANVQATVTDVGRDALIYALPSLRFPPDEASELVEAVRERVTGAIALHFDGQLGAAPRTPPLYAAYKEFITGMETFGGDDVATVEHLERAIHLDPNFFEPYFRLAVVHGNHGRYAAARSVVDAMSRQREQFTRFEHLCADWYDAVLDGRKEEALQALRLAERMAPEDRSIRYLLAIAALSRNRPEETVAYLTGRDSPWKDHRIAGAWWSNFLALAYHRLRRYGEELDVTDDAHVDYSHLTQPHAGRVRALTGLGRLAELERELDEVRSAPGLPAAAVANLLIVAAGELRGHGHPEQAVRVLEQALSWHRRRSPVGGAGGEARAAYAEALYQLGRWDESRDAFARLSAEDPDNLDYLGRAGTIAAHTGHPEAARRIAAELQAMTRPYLFGSHTMWRSRITSVLGDRPGAVALFQQGMAEGHDFTDDLHRDPDFRLLASYPPFERLMEPGTTR